MEELADLGKADLQEALRQTQADLEDLEEVRLFTLGQTGVHIGVERMRALRATWARDETRLRERIATIQARLEG